MFCLPSCDQQQTDCVFIVGAHSLCGLAKIHSFAFSCKSGHSPYSKLFTASNEIPYCDAYCDISQ